MVESKKGERIAMQKLKVAIIGGGASGLFLASMLPADGVCVFERADRVGKKLSATGNGQGNVTNLNFGAAHYFTSDQTQTGKIANILNAHDEKQMLSYLDEWNEMCTAGMEYEGLKLSDEYVKLKSSGEAYFKKHTVIACYKVAFENVRTLFSKFVKF
jgi:predicted NAD/FAD-dependent oxidoreductase